MPFRPGVFLLVVVCLVLGCSREPRGAAPPSPPLDPPPFYPAAHIVPSGAQQAAALAPGRAVTIYGEHLGPAQPCVGARPEPPALYPTRLCETEVHVGGVAAGLSYVAAGQINFQVPQSTPSSGSTTVQVLRQARPGPAVSVPLAADALDQSPSDAAAGMFAALRRVPWEQRYRPGRDGCTAVPAAPAGTKGGPNGHAYHCAALAAGITTESLYYPVRPADPQVLLLRADIRPVDAYPEWSAAVEQQLALRLTQAFGPGSVPSGVHELGASGPRPGLSWRSGGLTIFLNSNPGHLAPTGPRTRVTLVAVRDEILAQRPPAERSGPALAEGPGAIERTRAELLRLLGSQAGGAEERAAALVAADQLAVRLGSLLVMRTLLGGSENLALAANAGVIRAELAKRGVVYGEIGHYSGNLEYDRSLLRRAWDEYPETPAGQRAFLQLQRLGCATKRFACDGPNCFLAVITQGEKFLDRYPSSSLRTAQILNLALAHETAWSLGQARPGDLTAQGAQVSAVAAEQARLRAIEWYEELLRTAPGSPEARAAAIALPRLKLRLDTGERSFFCFSC
jgi:hypothetical protein